MASLTFTVAVPTAGRPEVACRLIEALRGQSRPPDELLIVEQGEAPSEPLRRAAAEFSGGRHVFCAVRSLPHARNVALREARGDVVLFLDDDVEPSAGLVQFHALAHDDPDVAGVGGRVTGGYDGGDGAMTARAGVFRPLTGMVVRNFHSLWACDADHLPGGNMSFKRSVFRACGPFEEAFGGAASLWEETDLCLRLRRLGRRLRYEPRAWVVHRPHASGGCRDDRFRDWLYWHAHNAMLYASRHLAPAPRALFTAGRVVRFVGFAIEHRSLSLVGVGLGGLRAGRATQRRLLGKGSPAGDGSGFRIGA